MELTKEQYERIEKYLPKQRGNVRINNLQFLNAILYVVENGCKWRALQKEYGKWHTIYMRMNRWSKKGVLDRVFAALQAEGIINVNVAVVCLDSTTLKVHPDACEDLKKRGKQAIGRSRGGLTTKIHTLTASERFAINFSLSSGAANDSPQGMRLLHFTPSGKQKQYLLMDRAYSGKKMRKTAVELGYAPVVPPKRNYKEKWEYDKERYKQRNER